MFVKICGITSVDDAAVAIDAGADAIGLNFVASSRRYVDRDMAQQIVASAPARVTTVGVFRGDSAEQVVDTVGSLQLDAAQLHGEDPPDFTAAVAAHVPSVIIAIAAFSPVLEHLGEHAADVVMLDAPTSGGGVPFDWELVGDLVSRHRILLAGGLRPDNVAEAIRQVRPWGVDVASCVEARADGNHRARKDPDLLMRFVAAARSTTAAGTQAAVR